MKSIIVNVNIIIDQFDNSDPLTHVKNVINTVNLLVGDLGGTQPKIMSDGINSEDLVAINLWDEEDIEEPTPEELDQFYKNWGQSHEEICSCLGYDEDTSDDLLMDEYFWLEDEELWCNKGASGMSDRDYEIVNHLRQ